MYRNRYLTFNIKDIQKLEKEKSEFKVKCDCGVTVALTDADRKICYRCGHWIYRNEQIRFRYEMLKKLREAKYEYKHR